MKPAVGGATGNSVIATLPPGTIVQIPEPQSAVKAAFVNESIPTNGGIVLISPLKLCTPSYITDRDSDEAELVKQIQLLKLENEKLRLNK